MRQTRLWSDVSATLGGMGGRASSSLLAPLLGPPALADRVTWTVIIPGAPPSMNHSYRPVMLRKRTATGTPYSRIGMAKLSVVAAYQTDAVLLTRSARPSSWQPAGEWIRVRYRFFLRRPIDCDNAMKALNDALALAIGVDDKRFLPCVTSKSVSSKEKHPRVEVEISDEPISPSPLAT
jgi:hypothetical protein